MAFPRDRELLNFYRLGPTKEKELFKRHRETYYGVVVPAHIASYYHKFCTEFVGALRKPYFVDPITYIFADNPEILKRYVKTRDGKTKRDNFGNKVKGDLRRSYKRLVEEHYGGPIKSAWEARRSLKPSDFSAPRIRDEFVNRVITFQRNAISQLPQKYQKYQKYAEKAGVNLSEKNEPSVILPPYFFIRDPQSSWLKKNIEFAKIATRVCNDIPIYPVIFCSLSCVRSSPGDIVEAYSALSTEGVIVWLDDFRGTTDKEILSAVAHFIQALRSTFRDVILLYGDSFSLVLSRFGLSGFSCGICYGETKKFGKDVDIEGSIPARYYIQALKRKYGVETTLERFSIPDKAPELACNCKICSRQPNPAKLSDTETKEHFMLVREMELATLKSTNSNKNFAENLNDMYKKYNGHPHLGSVPYLKSWASILYPVSE